MSSGDFRLGEWLVQPQLSRLTAGDRVAHVRPRTMDVLVHLAQRGGAVVAREQLLEAVWHGQHVEEEGLTHCIAELRAALDDSVHSPSLIETIPKRGYRVMTEPQWLTPAMPCRTQASRGVLVLPFVEVGSSAAQDLGAGLCEALIGALSRSRGLRVVSGSRLAQGAGHDVDTDQIGRRLNVCAVVEGSIRRAGNRVAVNARLVDVADHLEVWSGTFDDALDDVLDVQERAGRALAEALLAAVWPDLPEAAAGGPAAFEKSTEGSLLRVVELRRADLAMASTSWALVRDEGERLTVLSVHGSAEAAHEARCAAAVGETRVARHR
jgi:DNA-binding winged helix-turn-helix (wHTH) protein